MKRKNVVKRLENRIKGFNETVKKEGRRKPGSFKR